MMKYAFLNSSGIVVNCISGPLTAAQQAQFLHDYSTLFGATQIVEVADGTSIWIGGAYADGEFLPPVEPVIVEGTSEVIEEPAAMIEETAQEPEI